LPPSNLAGFLGSFAYWLRDDLNMGVERLTALAIEAVSAGWDKITATQER
jgi:hypothetical protein